MVSPELIRRFPIFSGLTIEQIVSLAKAAEEQRFERDYYFHHEGDGLDYFYLLLEGEVVIVSKLPERKEIILQTLGAGDAFGWSAFVPPFASTAGAKAVTPCQLIVFDAQELRKEFEADCQFGYVMMQKVAMIIRDRLNTLRMETLAYTAG